MTIVVLCTCAVYVLDMFSNSTLSAMLYFSRYYIFCGLFWRVLTFVFVPSSSGVFWFAISMYFYWFIGSNLEREWGSGKFTIYYCSGVILSAVSGMICGYATISYINLSLFLAFATLFPNLQFLVWFIIPVKAKWLAWFDAALLLYHIYAYAMAGYWYMVVLIAVSFLNYLIFFSGELLQFVGRQKRSASRATMQFKRAAERQIYATVGYIHKCSVCGRTDTDYPDLEFRYCSKCAGYHCYCMDHIATHIHIQSQ